MKRYKLSLINTKKAFSVTGNRGRHNTCHPSCHRPTFLRIIQRKSLNSLILKILKVTKLYYNIILIKYFNRVTGDSILDDV